MWVGGAVIVVIATTFFLFARLLPLTVVNEPVKPAPQLMAKESDGLLNVTAEHLSKLQDGASIGGYPPFKPPDDDERYKKKIKDRSYSPQEANDWLKEINNFLRQLTKRHPGMTMEKILQRQGLSQTEVKSFLDALREAYRIADGMSVGGGVSQETVKTLTELLVTLGVSLP